MLRKEKFAPGEHYHIYNRTLFNISVFKDAKNCDRLMQAFLLANSTKSSQAFEYLRNNPKPTTVVGLIDKALEIARSGEKLVDVLCYAIMPDHYHILLKERIKDGITGFVHKCNISVAKYINIKTERRGPLFESLFKSKHIAKNDYLLHLSLYIHLNPLDFLVGKQWREHKIQNWSQIRSKLINYPYSSLKNFLGTTHENKIISETKIITEQFKDAKEYESFLREWSGETLNTINDFTID